VIIEVIAGIVGLTMMLTETKNKSFPHPVILPTTRTKIVDRGSVTHRYLEYRTPTHLHRGIDIWAPRHSNIYSVNDGKVIGIYPEGDRQGYGNSILILHSDGFSSFYAHLENFDPSLARGSNIYRGQLIGTVGSSGTNDNHPHLHLEILKGLRFFPTRPAINEDRPERTDPLDYLVRNNVTIGRA
jgi:murein DD-endopeptidase MepM/ murein hydrolase activator NlpD